MTGRRIIIGSHPLCDLVVDDEDVDARHAAIEHVPGFYVIYDLDSTNGTWIERRGQRLRLARAERRVLAVGDLVIVGKTSIPWRNR